MNDWFDERQAPRELAQEARIMIVSYHPGSRTAFAS
jgi:hypothetical protein